jgi:hypothetical protein
MGDDRAGAAGPLEGLRVLELGTLIAGPFTGRLLGDFGAEVIKVEAPGGGDPMRRWGGESYRGRSLWWPVQSRNKKLVTLDLRTPKGQDLCRRLAADTAPARSCCGSSSSCRPSATTASARSPRCYDIVDTLGFTAVIYLGYPLGSALSIPLMERFERKHLIMGAALGIGAFGMLFGFAEVSWLILVAGFLTTSVSNVFSNSFHIYQAEIFPTRMRATAVGTAYSLSRLSGAILPFITVAVLDNLGASAVFIGAFVLMIVLVVDVGVLGPRSTGLNLETASHDVPGGERVQAAR